MGVRPHYHRGTPVLAGQTKYPHGRYDSRVGSFPEPGRLGGGLLRSMRASLGVRFGREPKCLWVFGSGKNRSVSSGENRVVCVEDWVFGSGENRSASGCSVWARTEVCVRKDKYSPDECVLCNYVG